MSLRMVHGHHQQYEAPWLDGVGTGLGLERLPS